MRHQSRPGSTCRSTRQTPPDVKEQLQESAVSFDTTAADEFVKANGANSHLEELEEALSNENLKPDAPWGLAVYRTCYDDEVGWQRMREDLEEAVREGMEFYADNGVSERHRFVFMDDKAQFDGASPAKIRDHFEQWAKEELARNWAVQPVTEEMHRAMYGTHGAIESAGPRYNVCMLVDDVSLMSLGKKRTLLGPVAMLVNKNPSLSPGATEDEQHPDYEDGCMYDPNEGPGGWIYVSTGDYVNTYDSLHDLNLWEETYGFGYPSLVYDLMGLKRSPAFWRDEVAGEKGKLNTGSDK